MSDDPLIWFTYLDLFFACDIYQYNTFSCIREHFAWVWAGRIKATSSDSKGDDDCFSPLTTWPWPVKGPNLNLYLTVAYDSFTSLSTTISSRDRQGAKTSPSQWKVAGDLIQCRDNLWTVSSNTVQNGCLGRQMLRDATPTLAGHKILSLTPDTWSEKIESLEWINSIRETNENFNSCNSCKRLIPSRLHELHDSKFSFVSHIEFIRTNLPNFSAHVSGVTHSGGKGGDWRR